MRNIWRQIWIISFASLALWAAVLAIAYRLPSAVAQSTEEPAPSAEPAPAGEAPPDEAGMIDEGPQIGAPVTEREEVPPELRQSADNNISFPVDI
ncbi:MAG TPA: hypothetical protein PKL49_02320 [Steroidobacteraceae bacterium]|nr:hypothetical protein [Steroidobacteraceae bacterium]HNS26654.1 hypothetical protein [Steroidobacteraceae bacterium]